MKPVFSTILVLQVTVNIVNGAVPSFGRCPNVRGEYFISNLLHLRSWYFMRFSFSGIANFDKSRYLGSWYEFANVFEFYQIGSRCVRATYTDEGDRIGVFNEQVNAM